MRTCSTTIDANVFASSRDESKKFTVGDRVEGNWQMRGKYYSGVVTAISAGNITIQYDDDSSFESLPISSVYKAIFSGVGVDHIYAQLYEKAVQRSNENFGELKLRGDNGVIIGPLEGKRHILGAFQNAKRIRNILQSTNIQNVRVGTMIAEDDAKEITKMCRSWNFTTDEKAIWTVGCGMWANGTLFDDIILSKDEYEWNSKADSEQGSSRYWLKALGGYIHAPYSRTMFLDSDAYPCPGFQDLFDLLTPSASSKIWQVRSYHDVDFAAGIDQFPFGTGCEVPPGNMSILTDYDAFPERNTGTTLFNFHRQSAYTFAHFVPLVSEHIYNHVASNTTKIANDQCPFRVAMYLFRRLHDGFKDRQIPQHSSCRSYPGPDYADSPATDGFKNGMFPLLPDGSRCKECSCTPCLITHTPTHHVFINGTMGW